MAAWVEATTREMGQPLINPDKPSVSVPGDTEKPALNPKPLLTAKPFSLQRNATVRSIRAPKTNFTRPLHRAASSETFLNTTDTLETSDLNGSDRSAAHKPVPLSPKPDLQAKPKPEPTKSTNDQTGPNSKLDVPTEDLKNVQPRSRAKSLGSRENQKKEQGSDPDVKVPSRLWPARNRLSADLTSKFQSPPQPDTVGRETEKEEPPLSPSAVSESPVENEEAGCSIKRRISLLFDRSAVSQINKRDVTPAEISIDIKQRIQNLSLPSTGAPKSPPYEKTNERSFERETEKVTVDKPPNTPEVKNSAASVENAEEEEDDEEDEENYVAVPVYQRVRMSIDAEKKLKEEEEKQRKDQQLEKERQKQEEMGRLLEEERKAKEIERQQEEERKQQEEKQKQMEERRKQEEEWKRKIEEERKEEERRRQAEKEKERQQEQERLEREKQVEEEKRRTEEEEERQRDEEQLRQEKLKKERELEEERQRVQEMERQKEEEKLRKEREIERIRKEKEMEEERLKEEERLRQEREKERLKKEKEMEEERRRVQEMERQKEEERLRKEREIERIRKEKEMEEERRRAQEMERQKEEERLRLEKEERLKKEREMEEERQRLQEMERQKEEEKLRKEREMERIQKEREIEERKRMEEERLRQEREREKERLKKEEEKLRQERENEEMERSRSPEIRPEEVLDASQTLVSSPSPQLHEVLYDDFSVKPRRWGTGARRSSTPSPSREPEQNLQPEPTSNDPGSQEPCGERGSVEELMGSEPENCEYTPPVSELDTQADEGQLKDCEPEEDGVAEQDTENLIGETDEQSENNDDVDGLGTESRISHALQRLTRVRQRNRSTDSDRADVPDEEESRVLPVLESAAPLLDSSVLRSKVDLAKKRSIKRSMPTRAVRQRGALPALTEGTNPDWRFCDSTDAKDQCSNGRDSESEEEPSRDAVPTPAPCQPKRVPMFPGMNPSALMAQLKRRSGVVEAESPTEAQTPPSVPARSPRTPTMALGPRVLPPVDAKDNASGSSPSWLLELKSKKKMNQPDSEA